VIIVPAQTAQGGISNYYQIIRNYFDERVVYLYRGSRNYPYKKNVFVETWRIIKDYLLFCKILSQHDVKLVQTTTALTYKSVIRDGIYIFLAKLFGKKTIVFYRGWDIELEKKISKSILFKSIFLKTNASIVLSNYQYKWLKERNVNNIFHSTTIIDDKFINYIKEKEIVKKYTIIFSKIGERKRNF
jgi:hypothetical protein